MPIGSLEAGKKQLGVWLQYACNMAGMPLYFSFVPLVFLWPPYGDWEMSRRSHGGLTEVCASGCIGGMANEVGFVASQTYVHEA
jgi:hypothetical protein